MTGASERLAEFNRIATDSSSFAAYLAGNWEPCAYRHNLPPDWASRAAKLFVQDVQGGVR